MVARDAEDKFNKDWFGKEKWDTMRIALRKISAVILLGLLGTTMPKLVHAASPMGLQHLGAEYGAYDLDATGGIKLGSVKKGGNRLGYGLGGAVMLGDHGGKGKWVFIKVRPEDSKDGRLEPRFRRLPYGDALGHYSLCDAVDRSRMKGARRGDSQEMDERPMR